MDGVEIFGGRIGSPTYRYSTDGTRTRLKAYDYTVKLTDYLTPYASYVDTSTGTYALSILTNSPFTRSVDDVFGYDSPLWLLDTWLEAVLDVETYNDTTPEITITNGPEVADLVNAGTWTGCAAGLKSTFYYDGTTQRFYVFVKNAAGDLYYYHSSDGDTWTGVDTTYNPSGDYWSVAWHDDKVYLFIYDGANTDFYRGTITDGTGVITFGVSTGNIFTNTITFGPVWDDQGDMWVIRNNANGQAYESSDDGLTFTYRFGPGANSLHGILPVGSDGDMWGFALDTANTDLEEWLWDRSAGTFTFQAKIEDEDAVDQFDGCCDAAYNWYITWIDTDTECWMATNNGGIASDLISTDVTLRMPTVSSDGYMVYIGYTGGLGYYIVKYYENDQQEIFLIDTRGQPIYCSSPRGYLQDGEIAVFFTPIDSTTDDPYFYAFPLLGIRLVEDALTGYFQTDSITASGAMVRWGRMIATGTAEEDTVWSVLDAGDDSVICSGQAPYFDLTLAGVLSTTTSIKLRGDFTYDTTDILITQILLTEMVDALSVDVDYDNIYTAMEKWRKLSGGEYYLDSDDMLHLVNERGVDRSSYVVLKNSISDDYPDVVPNIKLVEVYTDWDSYANSVRVLGDGEPPFRAEGILVDQTQVDSRGEHWAVLRDPDLVADAMAYTAAMDFLSKNSQVIQRVSVDFIDPSDAGDLGIGDYVTLAVRYKSRTKVDVVIDTIARVINLTRSFSASGTSVSADLITVVKNRIFYNYLKTIDDSLRWITA